MKGETTQPVPWSHPGGKDGVVARLDQRSGTLLLCHSWWIFGSPLCTPHSALKGDCPQQGVPSRSLRLHGASFLSLPGPTGVFLQHPGSQVMGPAGPCTGGTRLGGPFAEGLPLETQGLEPYGVGRLRGGLPCRHLLWELPQAPAPITCCSELGKTGGLVASSRGSVPGP